MHLYEVIRWGNESDDVDTGGPDGPDTCFLVRATSVEQAAAIVDRELARMPSEFVMPWAAAVYLLGDDASTHTDAAILRGPYIARAYRHGWRHWYREDPGAAWDERIER
ncbi:hypothetical protein [Lysobacter claricitrinus]|uniref:hypothetical protein n=1 Tax=Lysobacter claricitrinus TaxID=3367728 RepID=UPI0037DB9402